MTTNKNNTYHITTFGCQMNVSDSERVSAVAENMGYSEVDDIAHANLIIINSCSIRQKAEDRVMGMGKRIAAYKEDNPNVIAVLTGCMAKREARGLTEEKGDLKEQEYEKSLRKLMPWLDHIVEIKNIHKLPYILDIPTTIDISEYLSVKPKSNNTFSQYIPVSTGCNKFCTYCIVPFSRGRELYRPLQEIMDEVISAITHGAKEITLVGQNVNSWRGYQDLEKQVYIESLDPHRLLKKSMPEGMVDFADLLSIIGEYLDNWMKENNQKVWIKFISSHPYDIDEKLIDVVKQYDSIAKQFHFALQSGSNSVLKRMNRHYTIEDFIAKCEMIRANIPGVGISTDVIVGFCGETQEEFEQTVSAIERLQFDQAFIAEYSPRKGTVAARVYKDDVDNAIKSERKERLNDILSSGNLGRNQQMVGQICDILVYKKNKLGYVGRTDNNKDVVFENQEGLQNIQIGDFVTVTITGCTDWGLIGKI